MSIRWLFLDLNSYFASVEQELRPELRGKPVAVVPMLAETTVCIAASYEAKKFGVKTGTVVRDARKLCPGIQFVEGRHELYVQYHHRIVEAVESCLPVSVVMSIDEMACKLIGSQCKEDKAIQLSELVKKTIQKKVGSTLRCSIGLAPNRFLAKVASDMQKPDGLVIIKQTDLPHLLYSLKLMDLPGIGPQMNKKLQQAGITTMKQLCALSKKEMTKAWGSVVGEHFWHWLKGEELELSPTKTQSVGHSHVLPPDLRTLDGAYAIAQKLLHKAASRLRKMQYWTTNLAVSVRFMNHQSLKNQRKPISLGWGAQNNKTDWSIKTHLIECQDTLTLLESLQSLWQKMPKNMSQQTPLAVGVTLYGLIPDHLHTFSLFNEKKRTQLTKALDAINIKYGSNMIYFGGIHQVRTAAPTRIAFTSIPDEW